MGNVNTAASIGAEYTSNYKFEDSGNGCFFCVSVGDDYKLYDLPKGYVSMIYPDTINDNVSADWQAIGILNRVGKMWSYGGTSDREISFSIEISKDVFAGGNTAHPSFDEFIGGLRSCVYPSYPDGGMYPPIVIFRFGQFRAKGIVKSVGFTWKKPIIENGYSVCSISIQMVDLAGKVKSNSDIRNGGYLNPFTSRSSG